MRQLMFVSKARSFIPILPSLFSTVGMMHGSCWEGSTGRSIFARALTWKLWYLGALISCDLLLDSHLGCWALISEPFTQSSLPKTKFSLGRVTNTPKENRGFGLETFFSKGFCFYCCQLFHAFKEVFVCFLKKLFIIFSVFSWRGDLNNPEEETS